MIVNALRKSASALGLAGALVLSACTPMYGPGWERDSPPIAHSRDLYPGYGSVHAIDLIRPERDSGIGVGAIAGAVIGGLIGHQIGEGNGNTAATVIGAWKTAPIRRWSRTPISSTCASATDFTSTAAALFGATETRPVSFFGLFSR